MIPKEIPEATTKRNSESTAIEVTVFSREKQRMMKSKKISKSTKSFSELLDKKYGRVGTKKRDKFEETSKVFILSEILKAAREDADMTQEQLAEKIGTRKSYISRIENGKADIQLSTLFKIFEQGLGRRIVLEIK